MRNNTKFVVDFITIKQKAILIASDCSSVHICNQGKDCIYIGGKKSVTPRNGIAIYPGSIYATDISHDIQIYAIAKNISKIKVMKHVFVDMKKIKHKRKFDKKLDKLINE